MTLIPEPTSASTQPWPRRHRGKLAAILGALAAAVVAVSCATSSNRAIVMPPAIGGATYLGSDACSQCHETYTKDFASSVHARLVAPGPNAVNVGCESCHGPGSVHVESGGAARTIVNPARNPETCYSCHSNLRGQFALPNHHPVPEGRLSCSACHDSHRGDAMKGGGTAMRSAAEVCLSCHKMQRGPHVFEHEAMREGCATCHQPHGSVHQKLLTERNAVLCLKCHFQRQTAPGQIAIGAIDHTPFLARGTCWTAGCHEAVHGSQVSNSLRF